MYSNNRTGRGASRALGFVALFAIMLAMGLALAAYPAEAAPFAYVTAGSGTVVVIDTATNTVVTIVPVEANAVGVAVTPNGKRVYVANVLYSGSVSVIDTATNTVVPGSGWGILPLG
jgi:YVTN family beta-propeller protein